MPSPVAIAVKQAHADKRFKAAVARISKATDVPYAPPVVNARMSFDQRRALETEQVTAFLETLADQLDPKGEFVAEPAEEQKKMGEQNFPAQDAPKVNEPNNAVPAGGNAEARAKAVAMQSPVEPEVAKEVAEGGDAPQEATDALSSDPNGPKPEDDAEDKGGKADDEPKFSGRPLSAYAGKTDEEILAMERVGPKTLKDIRAAESKAK